jgi:uncharacterized repeat protein (TIGR01451 family)
MIRQHVCRHFLCASMMRLVRFHGLQTLFLWMVVAAGSIVLSPVTAEAQPADYTDPTGYPAAWPDGSWTAYTRNGSTIIDDEGASDPSNGGTAPNPSDADISSEGNTAPSFYFTGDGTVMFFRIRIKGTNIKTSGVGMPFNSRTWNILFDIDGDGFKEFILLVDGTAAGSGDPDDIVVIYEDTNTQKFTIGSDGTWAQDAAMGDTTSVDGESGSTSTWDFSPSTHIWDGGRTRIVASDSSGSGTQIFLDVQVPVAAFNASGVGGPTMSATTLFTMSVSTSASNTDPTQKDLMYDGTFTLGDAVVPTGDLADPNGNIYQDPNVFNMFLVQVCPTDSINVLVLDVLEVVSGSVATTIDSVIIEYYFDIDGNLTDDDNSVWIQDGKASLVSGTMNHWLFLSDATARAGTPGTPFNSKYLFRALVYDNQGNLTNSLVDQNTIVSTANPCANAPGFNASVKTVQDAPDSIAPNSTPTYVLTVRQTTSGDTAFGVVVTDTLSEYTPFLSFSGFNSNWTTSVDSAGTWGGGAKRYIVIATDTDSIMIYNFPGGQPIKFQVTLISPVGDNIVIENKYYVTATNASGVFCATTSFTVDSEPTITLAKFVNGVNDTSGVPGDSMIFSIVYSNVGTDSATNVIVIDANPLGTTYIANSVTHKGIGGKTDLSDGDDVVVTNPLGPISTVSVTIGTLEAAVTDTITFKTIIDDQ